MVRIGAEREDVVAITAAMMIPVGLKDFSNAYPERTFDVGIAEQHALTMAAGLAFSGLHPVVAVYATFLNRAFDQLLMDCAMHRAGVTVVLDRSGITGPDGASRCAEDAISGVVPGARGTTRRAAGGPRGARRRGHLRCPLGGALPQGVGGCPDRGRSHRRHRRRPGQTRRGRGRRAPRGGRVDGGHRDGCG